jgi:Ni/Fe-hydrogenase subunit HybB-like protein
VRGAFAIGGYGGVLTLHLLGSIIGVRGLQEWLTVAGIPLAAATAAYTAYLFAQAKARDLWQSPLLPPHMLVQSVLLGAAVLLPFGQATHDVRWILGGAALTHVLMVLGEITLTHPTAHAHLAVKEMTRRSYAVPFWLGLILVAVAVAAPWIGVVAIAPALLGVLFHEHAFVQSGQSVPLA